MTPKHCSECNYSLDGYAETETVCGACFDLLDAEQAAEYSGGHDCEGE